jgi:hypothetical protein
MFVALALTNGTATGVGEAVGVTNTIIDLIGNAVGTSDVDGVVAITSGGGLYRIAFALAEDRSAAVGEEFRLVAVAGEMRVATVAGEDRIAFVPPFGPDAVVAEEDRELLLPRAA